MTGGVGGIKMEREEELRLSKEEVTSLVHALDCVHLNQGLSTADRQLMEYLKRYRESWPYVPYRKER